MKLKQKLLGLGLAALLNGGCGNGRNIDFKGEIIDIDNYPSCNLMGRCSGGTRALGLTIINSRGQRAYAYIDWSSVPDYLNYIFEEGNTIKLKNCDYEVKWDNQREERKKVYILSDCELE